MTTPCRGGTATRARVHQRRRRPWASCIGFRPKPEAGVRQRRRHRCTQTRKAKAGRGKRPTPTHTQAHATSAPRAVGSTHHDSKGGSAPFHSPPLPHLQVTPAKFCFFSSHPKRSAMLQNVLLMAVALLSHAGTASAFSLAPLSARYFPPHALCLVTPHPHRRAMALRPELLGGFGRCATCL